MFFLKTLNLAVWPILIKRKELILFIGKLGSKTIQTTTMTLTTTNLQLTIPPVRLGHQRDSFNFGQ